MIKVQKAEDLNFLKRDCNNLNLKLFSKKKLFRTFKLFIIEHLLRFFNRYQFFLSLKQSV